MSNRKCEDCKQPLNQCICPRVAKFFKENGHLMKEKLKPVRFFYVNKKNLMWVSQ